ncbi:MAG: hypothetical protein ACYTEX_19135 [Planctomycetota bacterium]|jgi:Tfp pilus assembly protein PilE
MGCKRRQSGVTLVELLVVVGAVAALAFLGVPSVRALLRSFETGSGARSMINAAMASARAIAAKEQRYAGIRFQKAYDPDHPDNPLDWDQYMVFIINDTTIGPSVAGNLACRAVEGLKPIKLPDSVGVMDLRLGSSGDMHVVDDDHIDEPAELVDVTTFSILFSPSGRLLIHTHKAERARVGDDIFNSVNSIKGDVGMFLEDVDPISVQRVDEFSRTNFVIYEREEFKRAYAARTAMSGYLRPIAQGRIYINAYTGRMILSY